MLQPPAWERARARGSSGFRARPCVNEHRTPSGDPAAKEPWVQGTFQVERLVDLSRHKYTLEPNLTFTPDSKWIVFRSNLHGPTHVYAVEVARSK